MEEIRRNVKLFLVSYKYLFFQIIGTIVIVLNIIHGINNLYKENTKIEEPENSKLSENVQAKNELLKKESENKLLISNFIELCNKNKIEEAYSMLSERCIKEKYATMEKFKNEYIYKIFNYQKDYEIQIENNLYKVIIKEGILQTGKIDNRNSITTILYIEEDLSEKKIYIER